jgi:hypothetical protein
MNTAPGDSRGQIVGVLADLAPNQLRLLVRPAGDDAGDPTPVEAEALALFAFVFWWGRLARPGDGAAQIRRSREFVELIMDEYAAAGGGESGSSRGGECWDAWNPDLENARALQARHASGLRNHLRRRGNPETDADELLAAAARSFVFFFHVACGETREEFAGRSIVEHREARLAPPVLGPGPEEDEGGVWAARWRRVIPLLRREIAALRADSSLPGHVAADLVALRVFSVAARGGLLW